jgi:hypothetical protein
VKTYIVLPSTIFGIASTEFTEKGVQNQLSQQIPLLVKISINRGNTPIIGTGANVWPLVEIGESETSPSTRFLFADFATGKKKLQRPIFITSCGMRLSPEKILTTAAKGTTSSRTASTPRNRSQKPSPLLCISWAQSQQASLFRSRKTR